MDSKVARSWRKKTELGDNDEEKEEVRANLNAKWEVTSKEACLDTMIYNHSKRREFGPIDIYQKKHRRLFVLRLAEKAARKNIPWDRLEEKWDGPEGIFKVVALIPRLKRSGRMRSTWKTAEMRMKQLEIPTTSHLRVPRQSHLPQHPIRRALCFAVRKDTSLSPQKKHRIRSKLKLHAKRAPQFSDDHHAAKVIKECDLTEATKHGPEFEKEVVQGIGFKRTAGSAFIPKEVSFG